MLQSGTNRPEHELASAKHLLENCVKLLDPRLHPELVTSAYYLLSELYLFGSIVNVDDTSEVASDSNDSVQVDPMISAVSNTDPAAEPNVSFLSSSAGSNILYAWLQNLIVFVLLGLHQLICHDYHGNRTVY